MRRSLTEKSRNRIRSASSKSHGDGSPILDSYVENLENELSRKNKEIKKLKVESGRIISQMKEDTSSEKQKLQKYKNMCRNMKSRVSSLQSTVESLEMDNRELQERNNEQKVDFDFFSRRIRELEEQNERFKSAEVMRKNGNIIMKQKIMELKLDNDRLQTEANISQLKHEEELTYSKDRELEKTWENERQILLEKIVDQERSLKDIRQDLEEEKSQKKGIIEQSNYFIQNLQEINTELVERENEREENGLTFDPKPRMNLSELRKRICEMRATHEILAEDANELFLVRSFLSTVSEGIIERIGEFERTRKEVKPESTIPSFSEEEEGEYEEQEPGLDSILRFPW